MLGRETYRRAQVCSERCIRGVGGFAPVIPQIPDACDESFHPELSSIIITEFEPSGSDKGRLYWVLSISR